MIDNYLVYINQFLQTHVYLGLVFTFIVAFAESLPLIGTIIPGSITMSVIGILAGRGMIPISSMLFWASLGAFIGDSIGFWIGKHYNERLRYMWPFKKHPKWLKLSEDFFAKHGGKSILIGRFVGPARSSVPLIAGLLKMPWPRFLIAAIPSAILWAIVYMIPGILIGAISLQLPHGVTTKFMLIALVVVIFLWLLFWAIQRFFVFLVATANNLIDKLWNWLSRHHSSKFFIRAITVKDNPEDHHQLTLVILLLLSLLAFVIILTNVVSTGPLTLFNEPLFLFLQSIRTTHADKFFIYMTSLGEPTTMSCFAILVAIGLAVKKQWRSAFHLLALLVLTICAVYFFKWLIYSPRPLGFSVIDLSSSFPSGHTAMATTIISFIAYLTLRQLSKSYRWIVHVLTLVLIFLVGFSRLYLGAHWLTDVVGSLFLSFTILLLVIISYRRRLPPPFAKRWWTIFLILSMVIPWGIVSHHKFHNIQHSFERLWQVRQIDFPKWWNHPNQYLPIYRVSRFGKSIQPFNIQWADSLDNIKKSLHEHGWIIIEGKPVIKMALGRLGGPRPEQHLPLFQPLYRQQPPALLIIKHLSTNDSTIIELRLWQSGMQFSNSELPLWIGTINYHNHGITLAASGGIDQLIKDLSHYQFKIIQIKLKQPQKVQPLDWNGTILVIRAH
jgi:membrane protein DedA with SNARE-associated domain/membrane-associated phospholipid phosphatase